MTDLKPCPFCGEQSEAEREAAEPLTCKGCAYQADFPSHAKCHGCARSHTDHYRRQPEDPQS